jgi:Fur family ferric uptake transcriptional regulator/Fur family zinc uptake transcriptional regulator
VLRLLSQKDHPLAHSEIAKARGLTTLDRVTLYRTLTALQDAGLVHRVQDLDGAWRFCAHARQGKACPGGHAHFHCTRCGRMRCLTDQALPWISVSEGARVTGKQLVVYGLCPTCAAREG